MFRALESGPEEPRARGVVCTAERAVMPGGWAGWCWPRGAEGAGRRAGVLGQR